MELLQRRKFCREFLNGYNEKLHPQIISRVFEIGLLTLKRNFNKLLFSKEELDEIIKSLSGKEYVDIIPLSPRKKLQKLENKTIEDTCNLNKGNCTYNKEEEEKKKIIKNQQMHKNFLQYPNFTTQNKEIYPFWWWNNKEEDIKDNKNKINMTYDENIYNNNEYYDNENYYNNENNNNINEEENIIQEKRNEEMNNNIKNISMKKLQNQNQNKNQKQKENKNIIHNYIKNDNFHNKKIQNIKSKGNKSNNNIQNQKFKKVSIKSKNKNQNIKQSKPKCKYFYNNGRIIKIKEDNNDINMMNLTEPNNKF